MVLCDEPGCRKDFSTGRQRRRHVNKVHMPLPIVCTTCNNEPFLYQYALQQHIDDGHLKNIVYRSTPSRVLTPIRPRIMTANIKLFELRTEAELNTFIASTVQPGDTNLHEYGHAVNRLVRFLEHNAPGKLRPCRVIKGGSLCKGTAVMGKTDIDLAVMLRDYKDVHKLKRDMESILDDLTDCLKESNISVHVTGRTHRSVQGNITENGEVFDVDILPAVDILDDLTPQQVFDRMEHEESWMRGYYSPCLAPLQKKLFDSVPTKVKSLIRILKYWKKEVLQAESGRRTKWPVSYAIELIVFDTWRQLGEGDGFSMVQALKTVLRSLVNHTEFRIFFPTSGARVTSFYDRHRYDTPKTPYIMDPCNPFNNVYYKGRYDWEATATAARLWLQQPLFA